MKYMDIKWQELIFWKEWFKTQETLHWNTYKKQFYCEAEESCEQQCKECKL
jgi:hypothetical protein